jgi:hypothetical protein
MIYEKVVDYHRALRSGDPPGISHRGKSKCASDLTVDLAQGLLERGHPWPDSIVALDPQEPPEAVFSLHDGTWYEALAHQPGRYHGFPVDPAQVPPQIRHRGTR